MLAQMNIKEHKLQEGRPTSELNKESIKQNQAHNNKTYLTAGIKCIKENCLVACWPLLKISLNHIARLFYHLLCKIISNKTNKIKLWDNTNTDTVS